MAASVAYALYHALNLPQGYWAVFTTVIVIQGNVGATLTVSLERMGGTLIGALVGGLAAWLHPRTPLGMGVGLALAVAATAFAAAVRPSLRAAPVTAVIMLISPSSGAAGGPLETALLRVVEIAIGSVIGVAATLLIFPARAHRAAIVRIRMVLDELGGVIDACAAHLAGAREADLFILLTRVRRGLGEVEAAVTDAARERSTRLGEGTLPEAVVRTLWRVRNDVAMLSRTVQEGLPDPAGTDIRTAAAALLAAQAAFARACGGALAEGTALDRAVLTAAHDAFEDEVESVRRERLTRDLTFDEIGPFFGLVFAAESLFQNLGDLADRIDEARAPVKA